MTDLTSYSLFTEENQFAVMKAFFEANSIVEHQITSFENFVTFGLPIIGEQTLTFPSYKVSFSNLTLGKPQIIREDRSLKEVFPNDARSQQFNYDAPVLATVTEVFENGDGTISSKVHLNTILGRLPVMVRSKYCNLFDLSPDECIKKGECENDPGGYFIIKGNERVIASQMRSAYNQIFVLPSKKYDLTASIRSMSESTGHSVEIQAILNVKDKGTLIAFVIPFVKEPIPIAVLFKAMGYDMDEMFKFISTSETESNAEFNKILRIIRSGGRAYSTRKSALEFISKHALHIIEDKKKEAYAIQIVESELLPHIGISGTIKEQACILGMLVRKLILTRIGSRQPDDRDNYTNKRVEAVGVLFHDIFSHLFTRFLKKIRKTVEPKKSHPDIISIISNEKIITQQFHKCMSTGNWTAQKNATYMRKGVSQILERLTYVSALSHLRRVIIPIGKEGKNVAMRQIHPTSFGFICPVATPEGQRVGTVLNMSLTCRLTKRIPSVLVKRVLEKCKTVVPTTDVSVDQIYEMYPVLLNGAVFGYTSDVDSTILEVQKKRNRGLLDPDVSISYESVDKEVRIFSDEGRFIRPLLTLEDNRITVPKKRRYNWNKLVKEGHVRYVDAAEIENAVIAMYPKMLNVQRNDYCEIHPSLLGGVEASLIPFIEHMPSPRAVFQCIDARESVLMADGSKKCIADVKVGDSVITVDPDTYEKSTTKVIHQYVKPTEKYMVKVELLSGRTLVCTEDHQILTNYGWVEAAALTPEHKVCVTTQVVALSVETEHRLVLDKIEIEGLALDIQKDHTAVLRGRKILPLYSDSPLLPTLARMVGYLVTDGHCAIRKNGYSHIGLTFGSEIGCNQFLDDVQSLKFGRNKYIRVHSDGWGSAYQLTYQGALASLLIALSGNYTGKKVQRVAPPMPEWLIHGSKHVKREFLAGFQGGDGCKLRGYINKAGRFACILNSTSQTKNIEFVDSQVEYMKQIRIMFEELGIECSEVKVHLTNYDDKKRIISLPFRNTKINHVKYFETIGWRYDHFKLQESLPAYEYIKLTLERYKDFQAERKRVRETFAKVGIQAETARILGISFTKVNTHLRDLKSNRPGTMPKGTIPYAEWLQQVEVGPTSIFIPVKSVTDHENVMIADITTESDNHSFVTGNYIACHNCSMVKQALSVPLLSYNLRADTLLHVLHYPQQPLVRTKASEYLKVNKMGSGITAIVAIACFNGWNQEDGTIFNLSSGERGLFCLTTYRSVECIEKKRDSYSHEDICLPPKNSDASIREDQPGYFRRKNANYMLLDENGVIRERLANGGSVHVRKGDVLVGKIVVNGNKAGDEIKIDASLVAQQEDEGIVDRVFVTATPQGHRLVKVVIRQYRQPILGDKLASRSAQKGTIGMMYRMEDMPFTQQGIVPDVIMNPHAIPGRMTISQLIECVLGKTACLKGEYEDATPFTEASHSAVDKIAGKGRMKERDIDDDNIEEMIKTLKDYGFSNSGKETLYNGMTGEMFEAKIFIGPTYYQRLKHMSSDKMHARATGPVTLLTRQPNHGKQSQGGFRRPQWYLASATVLLVVAVHCNTFKLREHLAMVGTLPAKRSSPKQS